MFHKYELQEGARQIKVSYLSLLTQTSKNFSTLLGWTVNMSKVKPRTSAYDEWTHASPRKKLVRALQIFNNRKSKISGFAYDVIIQKLRSAKIFEELENV